MKTKFSKNYFNVEKIKSYASSKNIFTNRKNQQKWFYQIKSSNIFLNINQA